MAQKPQSLIKAVEINRLNEIEFHHPLNPNSEIYLRPLGNNVGFKRIAVSLARVPPGKESFIDHAHHNEEEWLYILSGRAIAEIGEEEYEVEAGDFMGFGLPQQSHHLRNPFSEELIYLVGGEKVNFDVGVFPRHGKRAIRDGEKAYIVDESSLQDFFSSEEKGNV